MLLRFSVLILALTASTAVAEGRRVALVIANSAYAQVEPLANPVNDGQLVADALKKAGFAVDLRDNLDLSHFMHALRDFRGQADGADIALIYYAGHGAQAEGENFLIPTDAEMAAERDLDTEGVDLERLMVTLSGAKMRVAILDACRNNPFRSAAQISSVTNGLAQVDVDDVLVIFSAAPGQPATDGTGSNSPFATALAKRLPEPGLPLQLLGGVVRDDVIAATARKQRPFISASVTGQPYYLVAQPSAPPYSGKGALVIGSSGPSAISFPAGKTFADTDKVILKAGDSLTILDPGGTRTLTGPGSFTTERLGTLVSSSVSGLRPSTDSRQPRTGAIRTGSLDTPPSPSGIRSMARQFVNATGEKIVKLSIAGSGSSLWAEDALGSRTMEVGDVERLDLAGASGCTFDLRAETSGGKSIILPGIDACKNASITIAPPITGHWTASDPRLPLSSVTVERSDAGSGAIFRISGTYPLTKRDGSPAPQARLIRVVPRRIVGGIAIPIRQVRQSKVGLWNPGAPFTATFRLSTDKIGGAQNLDLRLCIGEGTGGDAGFCFFSPNLIKGGPQQLLPTGPSQRRQGIARRDRRG